MQYRSYDARRFNRQPPVRTSRRKPLMFAMAVLLVFGVALVLMLGLHHGNHVVAQDQKQKSAVATKATATHSSSLKSTVSTTTPIVNHCTSNKLSKLALVSIGQRRLWACDGTTVAYGSAVVTGMENLPADLTPVGTYHVYGKQTNLYLNGSDSTGSWHDYVYYWMPFLDNQYGAYGFHDATWRPANAFGNISPYSSNASHGCVELPLATAKWLYNWVNIGTTVTIES